MPKPSSKTKLIAIVGPTASGKTSLSITLAQRYDGEIVSADSRQIYRGMDIGTAKPGRDKEQETGNKEKQNGSLSLIPCFLSQGVPHHLIDIRDPDEDYTVADYQRDAQAAITNIIAHGKLPIIVGGTGLYVRAVLENLDIPRAATDPALRARIERDIAEHGLAAVFAQLVTRDPEAAYIVDPKNPRRVVRALEVAITTGEPFTAQRRRSAPRYDTLKLGLGLPPNPPPEILRERIDRRVDLMMQDGLVAEVEALVKKYGRDARADATGALERALPIAFDAIGYREIIDYLAGKISLERAIADMKINTWHYAKRQMTWFKTDHEIHWIKNREEANQLINSWMPD